MSNQFEIQIFILLIWQILSAIVVVFCTPYREQDKKQIIIYHIAAFHYFLAISGIIVLKIIEHFQYK